MKYLGLALLAFIIIYGSAYLFNHINAWLGLGSAVLGIYGFITLLIHIFKNKQKTN